MNQEALKELIEQYKADFPEHWEKEKYKWVAVKHFQDHWNIEAENFGQMFDEATSKTKNLLDSGYTYRRGMILEFAALDPMTTKQMFVDLFKKTVPLEDRIKKFGTVADELLARFDVEGKEKHHYQDNNAICTYLWLMFPDDCYIYKYSTVRAVAEKLNAGFRPTKSHRPIENITRANEMYDEIRAALQKDDEFLEMLQKAIEADGNCWPDKNLCTATQDFGYFVQKIMRPLERPAFWKISHDDLSAEHRNLFKERNVVVVNGQINVKGGSDVPQGEDFVKNIKKDDFFYLCYGNSIQFLGQFTDDLAVENQEKKGGWYERPYRVIAESKNTSLYTGAKKWWTPNVNSTCIRMTDKLLFEKLILKPYFGLKVKGLLPKSNEDHGYWWLNTNQQVWSFSEIDVGDSEPFALHDENGKKHRVYENFLNAKLGDQVIGYEATPSLQIVALGEISAEAGSDEKEILVQKTEDLDVPIPFSELKKIPELNKSGFFNKLNGTLIKLTKDEYEFIMKKIREENSEDNSEKKVKEIEPYSEEKFLEEVYISAEDYKELRAILENKLNVILQGPPGVGKTFAAKRLAYSIMGEKDDSRIEFVQFHQNYSYEDFVMGYKPAEKGEGFKLKEGIFFKFCERALAESDPNKKYFFIIDEINRGNMSKIFGELLMLIENDKREEYSVTLPYTGKSFKIPKNLYIIGMMNTADRSLAMIDYALRRRFAFFPMAPAFESKGFEDYKTGLQNKKFDELIKVIGELNEEIKKDGSLGEGFMIGHSYFCNQTKEKCDDAWMKSVVEFEIIPMLKEYWFDDSKKADEWKDKLRDAVK